jgi:ribosomal protein S7
LLVKKGKKYVCFKIVDTMFKLLDERISSLSTNEYQMIEQFYLDKDLYVQTNSLANLFFEESIEQLNPLFKFEKYKSKRGRRTEMIPIFLSPKDQVTLALKGLINNALKRSNKNSISQNLSDEIFETCFASKNHFKSRNELFKLAYINRRRVNL